MNIWNYVIMNENLVILEWGLKNFEIDLNMLMTLACEKDKYKSIKWLCEHMKKTSGKHKRKYEVEQEKK